MSPTPRASKAFQAFVHVVKAKPDTLKLSEYSNTKLLTPNLQPNPKNDILTICFTVHNF